MGEVLCLPRANGTSAKGMGWTEVDGLQASSGGIRSSGSGVILPGKAARGMESTYLTHGQELA